MAELLSASSFNYARWMWPTTVALIYGRSNYGVFLLVPRMVRIGTLAAAALLIAFAGYALYYVYVLHGEPLKCGCFGGNHRQPTGVKTALRNLALLVPVATVLFVYKKARSRTATCM